MKPQIHHDERNVAPAPPPVPQPSKPLTPPWTVAHSETAPLVAFLYLLMRDHVVPGDVASLVKDALSTVGMEVTYTNGHLAAYAEDLAHRLTGGAS